jgi:hypothetical protein
MSSARIIANYYDKAASHNVYYVKLDNEISKLPIPVAP